MKKLAFFNGTLFGLALAAGAAAGAALALKQDVVKEFIAPSVDEGADLIDNRKRAIRKSMAAHQNN
ncbi:DUF3042 family protein [Lactobacillus selangorensis]|nr:DUF3042 family protein [Lactobacillus selangorensis]